MLCIEIKLKYQKNEQVKIIAMMFDAMIHGQPVDGYCLSMFARWFRKKNQVMIGVVSLYQPTTNWNCCNMYSWLDLGFRIYLLFIYIKRHRIGSSSYSRLSIFCDIRNNPSKLCYYNYLPTPYLYTHNNNRQSHYHSLYSTPLPLPPLLLAVTVS